MVLCPSWFMKESISSAELDSSGICGGGSGGSLETMGYSCA